VPYTSLGSPSFPLATRELPVPAEQSLGRDEKATPAPPWKYSAEHSEDRSVCASVAHAAMELPLEQADLVVQHHELALSRSVRRRDPRISRTRHATR
jgi:hypothetical protein